MMKLSAMLKVDCTVGANGWSPVAEQILKYWEHEQGSLRFFRSSANFVYVFRGDGRQRFLRFAESSERTRATIETEIDILHWVADRGMTVATPTHRTIRTDTKTSLRTKTAAQELKRFWVTHEHSEVQRVGTAIGYGG